MEGKTVQRYDTIYLAKFIFTLMIAVFHFWAHYKELARGGFIAVEFFFIVSGFFLLKTYEAYEVALSTREGSAEIISPFQYTWLRIKKLYPHYLFSFLVIFLYRNLIISKNGLATILNNFLKSGTEIFMVYGTILSDEKTHIYNSSTWYISVMLLVGYLLWFFLKKNKSAVLVLAPVISFWIYAYMAYTLGTTDNWRSHVFEIFNYAIFRATAGLLLGIVVYRAQRVFVTYCRNKSHILPKLYLAFGTVVLLIAIIGSYQWFYRASFFYIICFVIGIIFLITGEELLSAPIFKDIKMASIGNISYAMYLNHYLIIQILKDQIFPIYRVWIIPIYLLILILYSIFTTKLIQKLKKLSVSLIF